MPFFTSVWTSGRMLSSASTSKLAGFWQFTSTSKAPLVSIDVKGARSLVSVLRTPEPCTPNLQPESRNRTEKAKVRAIANLFIDVGSSISSAVAKQAETPSPFGRELGRGPGAKYDPPPSSSLLSTEHACKLAA